jgi:hypothetical protein
VGGHDDVHPDAPGPENLKPPASEFPAVQRLARAVGMGTTISRVSRRMI